MRPLVVFALLGSAGCATSGLTQRASVDLGCPESSIALGTGSAGAILANGCGHWIEYSCDGTGLRLFCTEEGRGVDMATGTARRPPSAGDYRGACFGNQTCFAPLVCVDHLCVRPSGPGHLGGSCVESNGVGGLCDAPLRCVDAHCEAPPRGPPPPAGSRSGPCYPNATCNAGFRCLDSVCIDSTP